MDYVIQGRALVAGTAEGTALASTEPLSFWGGYDSRTGEIVDRAHPLAGQRAGGRVLVLPFSRGSSTTTAVLLEAIRAGTAPAAIVVSGADSFFALAAFVAEEMYGRTIPIVAVDEGEAGTIRSGDAVRVTVDGRIEGRREAGRKPEGGS